MDLVVEEYLDCCKGSFYDGGIFRVFEESSDHFTGGVFYCVIQSFFQLVSFISA